MLFVVQLKFPFRIKTEISYVPVSCITRISKIGCCPGWKDYIAVFGCLTSKSRWLTLFIDLFHHLQSFTFPFKKRHASLCLYTHHQDVLPLDKKAWRRTRMYTAFRYLQALLKVTPISARIFKICSCFLYSTWLSSKQQLCHGMIQWIIHG